MKQYFLIFISFMLFSISTNAEDRAFLNSVDSVLSIIDTRWELVDDGHISCVNFEKHYGFKGRMIKDHAVISELCRQFKQLKITSPKRIAPKSKFYFFSSDTIIATACIDVKYCLVDGEMYVTSPTLISYIDSISNIGEKRTWHGAKSRKDSIETGIEQIQNFINSHIIKENNEVRIRGYCHADTKGNVVFVKIVNNKTTLIPSDYILELERIIKLHVKWNINKERNIADMIPFSIVLP